MGFFVMMFSAIIGVLLVLLGFSNKNLQFRWKIISGICGFFLVGLAIWLGFPK